LIFLYLDYNNVIFIRFRLEKNNMLRFDYFLLRVILLITLIAFAPILVHAQITGIIVDAQNNKPVNGATIVIALSEKGTVADKNGRFKLVIDDIPTELVISAVGYHEKKIRVTELDQSFRILLEPIVIESEEIFIQADRLTGNDGETRPVAITSLVPENFSNAIQASAPELLRAQPGVFVQQTSVGQGSVYVRGRAGRDVLYIFNGFRLNPGFVRSGQNQYFGSIDPFSTAEIDVYRGPVSVYYGSDALSGGVHVKPVIQSYSASAVTGGQILTRGNAGGTAEKTFNGHIFQRNRNYSLYLNGTFRDFGMYNMPGSSGSPVFFPFGDKLENADYKFFSFQGSGRFRLSSGMSLNWVSFHSKLPEAPRFDRMTLGFDIESEDPPTRPRDGFFSNTAPLEFSAHSLAFQLSPETGFISSAGFKTGFHHLKDDRLTIPFADGEEPFFSENPLLRTNNFLLSDSRETDNNRSNQWLFSADLKSIIKNEFILNYGLDFSYERISSRVELNGEASGLPRFPDGSEIFSGGVFVHFNIGLIDKINLEGGLRYSRSQVVIPFEGEGTARGFDPFSQAFSQLTGSAGLRYNLTDRWDLTGNFSTGFRAPNVADLSELGIRRSDQFQTANPDLSPEETFNIDFGLHHKSGIFSFSTHLFWLHYFDKIDRVDTGNIVDRTGRFIRNGTESSGTGELVEVISANIGTMDVLGTELESTARFSDHLNSGFTFSYTWGATDRPEGGREPVDRIPPANGMFYVEYSGVQDFLFRPQIRYAFEHRRISPDEVDDNRVSPGGTDGFTNLQLISSWNGIEDFELKLIADNIFNTQYREHASSLDGLARNVTISLQYSF